MSTDLESAKPPTGTAPGFPELTELGKRIEMLRIQRGLSKQHLAQFAGASRQQLWRVLTGKSELTDALAARLALALNVRADSLRADAHHSRPPTASGEANPLASRLTDPDELESLFGLLPAGADGIRLKRALLDVAEELCLAARQPLPAGLSALRERVVSDAIA